MQKSPKWCAIRHRALFNQETCMSQTPRPDPRRAPEKLSRRTLFAGASTVGALAAVATVLPRVAEESPQVLPERPKPERGGGYSLTDHVKQYYKTTRV
jgi:hypothetical protein